MEQILAAHWPRWQTPMGCACGALSDHSPNWHAHHVADALRAAGYGRTERVLPPLKPEGKYMSPDYSPGFRAWCNRGGPYEGYHQRLPDGSWSDFYATNPHLYRDGEHARLANPQGHHDQ